MWTWVLCFIGRASHLLLSYAILYYPMKNFQQMFLLDTEPQKWKKIPVIVPHLVL